MENPFGSKEKLQKMPPLQRRDYIYYFSFSGSIEMKREKPSEKEALEGLGKKIEIIVKGAKIPINQSGMQ